MADNNKPLLANDDGRQNPLEPNRKNRLKEAGKKIKAKFGVLGKLVVAKFKLVFIILLAIFLVLVVLSVAYYYILLDESEQKEFDKKNLPGVTSNVMNSRAVVNSDGEVEIKTNYSSNTSGSSSFSTMTLEAGGEIVTGTYGNNQEYWLYVPEDTAAPKPLVVYQHGNTWGQPYNPLGSDGGAWYSFATGQNASNGYKAEGFDYYALEVQNGATNDWQSDQAIANLTELVYQIIDEYNIDTSRVSLWGFSNGAEYLDKNMNRNLDLYTSMVILARGAYKNLTVGNYTDYIGKKVYCLYGEKESGYGEIGTPAMYNHFVDAGVDAKLEVTEGGHGGTVGRAIHSQELFDFIFGDGTGATSSGSRRVKTTITSLDNFLFVGDSRYVLNGMQQRLQAMGNNVSVRAVSGSKQSQWISVVKNGRGTINTGNNSSVQIMPQESAVSGISVMLGANEINNVEGMKTLLEELHTKYPNVPIIVNSVYHMGKNHWSGDAAGVNAAVDSFNKAMKEYCESEDWLGYIDIQDGLYDDDGYIKPEFSDQEGIHLTGEGVDILLENIEGNILGYTINRLVQGDGKFLYKTQNVRITKREDGEYCYSNYLDARVDEIYKILSENHSSSLKYFKNEDEMKKSIRLWILAEYTSQYVNLSSDVEGYEFDINADYIQGHIKVRRSEVDENGDEVNIRYITYVPEDEFDEMKKAYERQIGDEEEKNKIFEHFTIDSDENIIIAKHSDDFYTSEWTSTDEDGNPINMMPFETYGPYGPKHDEYHIKEQKLNYRDLAKAYTLPFNLLWTLVVYGEDYKMSNELAQTMIDNEFILGIRDNITTTTTTDVYRMYNEQQLHVAFYINVGVLGLQFQNTDTDAWEFRIEPTGDEKNPGTIFEDFPENSEKTALIGIKAEPFYERTDIHIHVENTACMALEYIDSWFARYEITYKTAHDNKIRTENEVTEYENTDYIKDYTKDYLSTTRDGPYKTVKGDIGDRGYWAKYIEPRYNALITNIKQNPSIMETILMNKYREDINNAKSTFQSNYDNRDIMPNMGDVYYNTLSNEYFVTGLTPNSTGKSFDSIKDENIGRLYDICVERANDYNEWILGAYADFYEKEGVIVNRTYYDNYPTQYEIDKSAVEDPDTIGEPDLKLQESSMDSGTSLYDWIIQQIGDDLYHYYWDVRYTVNITDGDIDNILDPDGGDITASIHLVEEHKRRTVNKTKTTTVEVDTKKFSKVKTKLKEKTDREPESGETENFVSIFIKDTHANARRYLTGSISSWFFEAVEINEDTKDLVDLLRYLFFKTTNQSYGVTKLKMNDIIRLRMGLIKSLNLKGLRAIRGDTPQAKLWFALKDAGLSDMQAAAVMGNVEWESGFIANIVETAVPAHFGADSYEDFTDKVDNGIIDRETFTSALMPATSVDGKPHIWGYGLPQWSTVERKGGLYDFAQSRGTSIGDIDLQVEYLVAEITGEGADGYAVHCIWPGQNGIRGYTTDPWYSATSDELDEDVLWQATLAFCFTFERPGGSVASVSARRCPAALKYYNEFHGATPSYRVYGEEGEFIPEVWNENAAYTWPYFGGERGSGIAGYYTTGDFNYICYKQEYGYWSPLKYDYGTYKTIGSSGCGLVSTVIVASGMFGIDLDPYEFQCEYLGEGNSLHGSFYEMKDLLISLGADPSIEILSYNYDDIVEHLESGLPVIALVKNGYTVGEKSYDGHYISFLGISDDGTQVMVGDPGGGEKQTTGWFDIDDVIERGIILYLKVY